MINGVTTESRQQAEFMQRAFLAAIIIGVVILNGLLGFVQEGRAEQEQEGVAGARSARVHRVPEGGGQAGRGRDGGDAPGRRHGQRHGDDQEIEDCMDGLAKLRLPTGDSIGHRRRLRILATRARDDAIEPGSLLELAVGGLDNRRRVSKDRCLLNGQQGVTSNREVMPPARIELAHAV